MTPTADIRAEAERLRAGFEARGAERFETAVLQPAGTLLDLYGEDIRARAFVTHDPLRGEMMLRPDFTVPLVQRHIAAGAGEARYTYAGDIFRRQEEDEARPTEYAQVGYEVIGHPPDDDTAADAEVFMALADALKDAQVTATIGSFALLTAAIDALDTPARRKRALARHLWRPQRFDALLNRFSTPATKPAAATCDAPLIGLRTQEEIDTRLALLREEAETPPLAKADVTRLRALMSLEAPAPEAVARLDDLGADTTGLARFLAAIDHADVTFDATFGLTSLEYYSGTVFGFADTGGTPVATGGRYDLLTAAMGSPTPAVGGVIRPDRLLAARAP
ncbi:MAG: ATP phosphoribosyltransferase regulatory subunit [Pseudomonadota bacterium]